MNSMPQEMPDKDVFVFDLDGTLARSKSPLSDEMAMAFAGLLRHKKAAIISGGRLEQFQTQVVDRLIACSPEANLSNLFLFPASGGMMYVWKDSAWVQEYAEYLSDDERAGIMSAFDKVLAHPPIELPLSADIHGEQLEDRGSQVTFSALGQQAPVEEKEAWDPDRSKREALLSALRQLLPLLEVHIGGITSIDISKKGIDKAYGIRRLSEFLSLPIDRMAYVGDALYEGGNDHVALSTGVQCIEVKSQDSTLEMLRNWLAAEVFTK